MMIFIWILVGLGIYYFLKNKNGESFQSGQRNSPVEVLKLRYANGEIDKETYIKILESINN